MKTAIIYGTTTGTSRKIAKIIASKLKGEVITIPTSLSEDPFTAAGYSPQSNPMYHETQRH